MKQLNLAKSVKANSSNIVISNIVTREVDENSKADEVNEILEEMCREKVISLIRNNNINSNTSIKQQQTTFK